MNRSLILCFATLSWVSVAPAALIAQSSYTVRDSAGVRIVENQRGSWARPWTLRETPLTRIESTPGFISAGSRLSDGSVVVLDVGSSVRWYSESGALLPSVGSFTVPLHVFTLPGDSVVVVDMPDFLQAHVSVFTPDRRLARAFFIVGQVQPVSRFANGAYLLKSRSMWAQTAESPARTERLPVEIGRFIEGTGGMQQLHLVSGPETEIGPSGRDDAGFARRARPFGRDAIVAGHASGWVLGDTDRAELELRRPDGIVEAVTRWGAPARDVTAADIEADRARVAGRVTNAAVRARMESRWTLQPAPPETMPVLGSVLLDGAGNVWAERYVPPAETTAGLIDVIDPSGVWLGTVQTPPGLRALAVGNDWLLGVIRSENGAETVLVLAIDKGPAP
jgi:hypothetical protein